MTYTTLKAEIANRILTLTLNRPERLNAFTGEMRDELIHAFQQANDNDEVRVIVVTGADRAFCAGADLGGGGGTFDAKARASIEDYRDGGGEVALAIFESKKPVIAAINGPAVGIGITMTLPMDIRLASETARFGFVFARRGITMEACSSWFLPRLVGMSQAMEWVSTGRVFGAAEALAGGLVSRVLPPEGLLPAARALAAEIAEHTSPVAVALNRQMMWRMLGGAHPMQAHRIDSKAIYYMGGSPDAAEGVTSFLEKRPPSFKLAVSKDMPPFFPFWTPEPFKEP